VGVRGKHGRLFLDFRWRGVRCREFTELTDTSENRRRCAASLKIIKGEITLGTFDYRRHFPHGTRLATFYPEVARSGTTVASFLSNWHARRSPFRPDGTVVEVAELHPSTWKHDGSLIERRLVPALGAIRLTELRVGRCRDYRRELEVEGLSGKTVTNILGLLHKAMADAVEEGLLLVNPVPRLARRSRRAPGMRSNSDPLALDEVKAFLEMVPAIYRDLYLVWFRTGWRPSEILAVRFDWLDVHRQTVMLRLGRIARWGGVEAPPKTGPREVDCRYDPTIFAAFERCRRVALVTGRREYVFTDQAGMPLSQEWLHKRVWLPTLRRCGLHARGQYNIRDTFITTALSAGEDPGWVAQVCGTSEQMIFRHYRRWMPALSRTDGRRIAALFGSSGPPRGPRRGHQDGHQRGASPVKSAKSQRVESGGGGNRTPVRRPGRGCPPVTRRRQVCAIPTRTIPARPRSDLKFPGELTRFEHAAW
jgi:integrase